MTRTTVEAIYENGILRLARPIDLADGTPVNVVVTSRPAESPLPNAPASHERTVNEILEALTALARPDSSPGRVARDHDQVLYGEGGAR